MLSCLMEALGHIRSPKIRSPVTSMLGLYFYTTIHMLAVGFYAAISVFLQPSADGSESLYLSLNTYVYAPYLRAMNGGSFLKQRRFKRECGTSKDFLQADGLSFGNVIPFGNPCSYCGWNFWERPML